MIFTSQVLEHSDKLLKGWIVTEEIILKPMNIIEAQMW